MKQICILYLLLACTLTLAAQQAGKEIQLQEVEVKAAPIIRKTDRQTIYPTKVQKESSTSGYGILQRLALPNIRVNETSHEVSAIDGRGDVQLRINGIIVQREEMLALNPSLITRIDFIDNPGVRYGEGTAYVINILTRRDDNGYTAGTDLTNALTARTGNNLIYGKWNRGKNEVSISYNLSYRNFRKNRTDETANYLLNDGSTHTILRNDIDSRSHTLEHNLQLRYNLADSADYVFQATLNAGFSDTPDNFNLKQITDGANRYLATQRKSNRNSSPGADLYFFKQFTPRQSLTLNAVGTYISTSFRNSYDEGSPYAYQVDGKTCSVIGEAVYENRLKPFTLTAGMNYMQKYTENVYTGDVCSTNPMHNRQVYAFAEIKGAAGNFRYLAGLGETYLDYRQQDHSYRCWLFRPKATLIWQTTPELQMKYDFQISEHVSQVAMISNTSIRNNSMEWTSGNPDITPNREQEHTFQIAYTRPRVETSVQAYWKSCHRPNMATYIRTEDNQFVYTQLNQKEINALCLMLYANCWMIPDKLSLSLSGTLFRCFNFGDDYTHCRTFYMGTASLQAYLGKFTLSAFLDNGWSFMEGETEGFNGSFAQLAVSYRHKNLDLSVQWQQPFNPNYRQFQSELYNRYLRKTTTMHCPDFGNLISLHIAWRFSKGRTAKNISRNIRQKSDRDTGILQ